MICVTQNVYYFSGIFPLRWFVAGELYENIKYYRYRLSIVDMLRFSFFPRYSSMHEIMLRHLFLFCLKIDPQSSSSGVFGWLDGCVPQEGYY